MPRYYFNVFDGLTLLDEEGTELIDINAARMEALQVAHGLIESAARRADLGEGWRIEVVNGAGDILFRMDFKVPEYEPKPVLSDTELTR